MAEGNLSNMIIELANSGNYDAILIDHRGYGYGGGIFHRYCDVQGDFISFNTCHDRERIQGEGEEHPRDEMNLLPV
jgi:hypothetical protein